MILERSSGMSSPAIARGAEVPNTILIELIMVAADAEDSML